MEQPTTILGYVYLITNIVNGKRYVGCTKVSLERRWEQHRSAASKGSPLALHCAIRKYGLTTFTIEIIETVGGTHDDLMAAEVRHIAARGTIFPSGYNLTGGGEGVDHTVPAVRAKHLLGVRNRSLRADWQDRTAEANRRKATDPEWLAATTEANRKKATDPNWRKLTTEAARTRSADPAWHDAMFEGARKRLLDPHWQRASGDALRRARSCLSAQAIERDAHLPPEEQARRARRREQDRKRKADKRAQQSIASP